MPPAVISIKDTDLEAPAPKKRTSSDGRVKRRISDENGRKPMDGPWQRAKSEWKDSWFGIEDCGRLLDVSESFGGQQTLCKWVFCLWMLASLIYVWTVAESACFLGKLEHWAMIVSLMYQTMSLVNAHVTPDQPVLASDGVNTYMKIFWVTFELAAHWQLLVTFVFWVIVFPQHHDMLTVGYGTFVLHGITLVAVWVDGMILNRIPVRLKHYFVVWSGTFVYCLWTIIHAAAGMSNGNNNDTESADNIPDQTDAIYLALDWHNQTVQSVFLMLAILCFISPLLYAIQFCLSLYSFPWTWNGSKSRKCLQELGRQSSKATLATTSNHQRTRRLSTLTTPRNSRASSRGNISDTSRTTNSSRRLEAPPTPTTPRSTRSLTTTRKTPRGASTPPPTTRRTPTTCSPTMKASTTTTPKRTSATKENKNNKKRSTSTPPSTRKASTPTPTPNSRPSKPSTTKKDAPKKNKSSTPQTLNKKKTTTKVAETQRTQPKRASSTPNINNNKKKFPSDDRNSINKKRQSNSRPKPAKQLSALDIA